MNASTFSFSTLICFSTRLFLASTFLLPALSEEASTPSKSTTPTVEGLTAQGLSVQGLVYEDLNDNGVYDGKDKPLPGVAVTNGCEVVRTDTKGRYTLPLHDKTRFIYITTPTGYRARSFYVPADALRASIEAHPSPESKSTDGYFALRPYPKSRADKPHRFIHISDSEVFNTEGHECWRDELRRYADTEDVAFIVHTGDICYDKGLRLHKELMNDETMGIPTHYTLGNHDLVAGKTGEALFESLYGPVYYSFDVGNTHYVVTPMLHGDHAPSYSKEDVYTWIKNDLATLPPGKPLVFFNHDLWSTSEAFPLKLSESETLNLHDFNLKAWLYGHWHIHFLKHQGKILSISTAAPDKGGIDHSPAAFRVLTSDTKGNVSSELRYSYVEPDLCLVHPSPADSSVPLMVKGKLPVIVNAYATASPVISVTCSYGKNAKQIPLVQESNETWTGTLTPSPTDYGRTCTLTVTASFKDGTVLKRESLFIPHDSNTPLTPILTHSWENLLCTPDHRGLAGLSEGSDSSTKAVSSSPPTPATPLTPPLTLAWTHNLKGHVFMSSPILSTEKIYIATTDDDLKGQSAIHVLNALTGTSLARIPVRNSIKNSLAATEGVVFAQDVEGHLYAVDSTTDTLLWEKKLNVAPIPALIDGLVAHEGIVYAGTGLGLTALRAHTGDILWQNKDWRQREGTTATLSLSPKLSLLIASVQWGALYGQDATTGKKLWQADGKGLRMRASSPVFVGDELYLPSDKSFFILNAKTGDILRQKELPFSVDVTSSPLVTDSEIIFGSVHHGLIALHRDTLEIKWMTPLGSTLVHTAPYTRPPSSCVETSPVLSGDLVYCAASDGTLYALERKTGVIVWTYRTGSPFFTSPALSGNALFIADFAGNVYAFIQDPKSSSPQK